MVPLLSLLSVRHNQKASHRLISLTIQIEKNIVTMLLGLLKAFIEELQAELRFVIYLVYLVLKLFHIIFSYLTDVTDKIQLSLKKPDAEEEARKTEEARREQEERDRAEVKKVVRRLLDAVPHKVEEVRRIEAERKLQQVMKSTQAEVADLNNALEREHVARVDLERKFEEVVSELEESIKARETEATKRA
eukprot:scaffold5114_cov142-Ochromonas_danica.AAC.1